MIPAAKDIMEACREAGRPVSVHTVYAWTGGVNNWPTWALVATADHCGVDLGALTRYAAAKWAAKHTETS